MLLCLIAPIKDWAQQAEINFEQNLSWEQVKEKAQSEHKYIFMDYYATWCGPCKMMDTQVYTNSEVADYVNAHFISVKVQLDSTGNDNEAVKAWYAESKRLAREYQIKSLPTLLFFNEGGQLVHKGIGFQDKSAFLKLAITATDTSKQEFALLAKFRNNQLIYQQMPYLIQALKASENLSEWNEVADKYVNSCLLKLKDERLYKGPNLEIMAGYIIAKAMNNQKITQNMVYKLFDHQADQIDKATHPGYAAAILLAVIDANLVNPILQNYGNDEEPDWKQITSKVNKRFGTFYTNHVLIDARIRWYGSIKSPTDKQMAGWLLANIENINNRYFDINNPFAVLALNNYCFNKVFYRSNDKIVLTAAAKLMQKLNKLLPGVPNHIDTQANLLYKLGKKQEAITLERKAVTIEQDNAHKGNGKPDNVFAETVMKMKSGEPTWTQTN